MNANPKVSVIIPVYNVEKDLPRCLDSVLCQSLPEIEVICLNDGSTDGSGEILRRYAKKDKRIKVFTQKNKGLSATRNRGLDEARGAYVFFLDSDDYLHPQTLEIFYTVAEKSKQSLVISTKFCRLGKQSPNVKTYAPQQVHYHIAKHPLKSLYTNKNRYVSAVAWNKLYRADIVRNYRFIEGIYFEDWPWTACLVASVSSYAYINENLYHYNTTSPSIIRSRFSTKKVADYFTGIYFVYQYFMVHNKMAEWPFVRRKRIAQSLKMVLSKISKSTQNLDELEYFFKQKYLALAHDKIIKFSELSLKTQFRLLRLLWHQRHK